MQTTMKKVKEATKGQKQIVAENQETLTFYKTMAFTALAIYIFGMLIFSTFSAFDIFLTVFAAFLYAGSCHLLSQMSTPRYTETGQLYDSGIDLNMDGGVAEHVKDLIILTAGCQVLSLYSNYFWIIWLIAPAQAGWFAWQNVLYPYIFQGGRGNVQIGDKKQKKLERRMRRQQWR